MERSRVVLNFVSLSGPRASGGHLPSHWRVGHYKSLCPGMANSLSSEIGLQIHTRIQGGDLVFVSVKK